MRSTAGRAGLGRNTGSDLPRQCSPSSCLAALKSSSARRREGTGLTREPCGHHSRVENPLQPASSAVRQELPGLPLSQVWGTTEGSRVRMHLPRAQARTPLTQCPNTTMGLCQPHSPGGPPEELLFCTHQEPFLALLLLLPPANALPTHHSSGPATCP